MTKTLERPAAKPDRRAEFVVDADYLRTQLASALVFYFAPMSGLYRAATGKKLSLPAKLKKPVHRKMRKKTA